MSTTAIIFIVAAYLLGSIPFGLLIGFVRGVDIRKQGSGNIGATNAGRILGKPWGVICLVLDIAKGLAPTLTFGWILVDSVAPTTGQLLAWVLTGAAAVVGHTFPIYLGFRGGKGVATTIGMALGIWPYFTIAIAASLVVFAVLRLVTGVVSIGSLAIAVIFPAAVLVQLLVRGLPVATYWPLLVVAILVGVLIIVRHLSNIRRLLAGEELSATAPERSGRHKE